MKSLTKTMALPYFFVGKDLATERIGNYATKHTLLTQALGKQDTRSVWYAKEHIERLLEEIDHAEGDGLRIFLGAYESTHIDFSGQTCLIMAVTREKVMEDNSVIHENVVLEDEPDFSERSALPRIMPETPFDGGLFKRKKDFNHGSPCPPLCDGFTGFDFP